MADRRGSLGAAAVLLLAGGMLAGCDEQGDATATDRSSGSPSEAPSRAPTHEATPSAGGESGGTPASRLQGVPDLPPAGDAAGLASHLARVVRVLDDDGASPADTRRAARFEQLAARVLGTASDEFTAAVLSRLNGAARARTRRHLEAAALLNAMTDPQPELPDWRIVDPPPPEELLAHYRFAAGRVGVPWNYLAAIHLVETRMGRLRGVSTAGALGPMQFLPTTWDLYGEGGDINDPRDAILAAARLLRANGAPGDMAEAVWHYNPSDNYVGAVTRYAQQLRSAPETYRGYWHWQVLYKHARGTYVLEVGYPRVRPRLLG